MSEEVGFTGGCLCRGIQYKYIGKFEQMVNCHCGMCRKATGASFYTAMFAERSKFVITEAGTMGTYASSETIKRNFCTKCGSTFYDDTAMMPAIVFLSASTLDEDPGIPVQSEIFTSYKAPWHQLYNDTLKFGELPDAIPVVGTSTQ